MAADAFEHPGYVRWPNARETTLSFVAREIRAVRAGAKRAAR